MRNLVAIVSTILAVPFASAAGPDFSRAVLPILSDHCFQCHGPDENARKADLRLDTRAGAMSVVEPGNSGDSELVYRLTSPHADELMPPPRSKKPLTKAQIDTITEWVDAGAAWGSHWAFTPPARPAVPADVDTTHPVRNPVDALCPGPARVRRADGRPGGRPRNADPPGDARSDRPAADARGRRCVRQRRVAGRL